MPEDARYNRSMTTVDEMEKMDMNYEEYPYEEELKLSADRDMFDKCCISCAAEDAFNDIDLVPEEEKGE